MNQLLKTISSLLFSTLLLLMGSCIKENMEDCPQIHFFFSYMANGESNVIGDYIDDGILYVFNYSDGQYINKFPVSKMQLTSKERFSISLPEGRYRVVCWGNASTNTLLPNSKSLDESLVGHPDYKDELSVLSTNDHLYYASSELTVQSGKSSLCEVAFISAHINLEVYVKNLVDIPIIEFHHLTPLYDFEMNAVYPYSVSYRPQVNIDIENKQYSARFQTLRFATDNPITMEILNSSGVSVYQLALADFMAKNELYRRTDTRTITTEGINELTIAILVEFKGLDVNVSIPDWEAGDVVPTSIAMQENVNN